jgi:sec-independent protein translocase protein TatA
MIATPSDSFDPCDETPLCLSGESRWYHLFGRLGPTELIIILVVVILIFGVGKLADVGGALGRGIKEFRKTVREEDEEEASVMTTSERPQEPSRPSSSDRSDTYAKDTRAQH